MPRPIMAKTGDRVEVLGIGTGVILKIRYDSNNEEIYTVRMEKEETTPDGLYYARHSELKWL